MSLKNLKLVAASPPKSADPIQRGREKLLSYLGEQRKLAEAEASGQMYQAFRTVRRKNAAGEMVTATAPVHVRSGAFNGADRQLYFAVRFAGKQLPLSKDANAVVVPDRAKLPQIIETLSTAVAAGELDDQITAAAAERRANFKCKDGKPRSA